jgi:hypothetical protein
LEFEGIPKIVIYPSNRNTKMRAKYLPMKYIDKEF